MKRSADPRIRCSRSQIAKMLIAKGAHHTFARPALDTLLAFSFGIGDAMTEFD